MTARPPELAALSALRAHEAFVVGLGGSVLEIAGARLVLHERIPARTFNYIVLGEIGPGRQAAFFERALDHYFQRAVRPAVFGLPPVDPHLEEGLRGFGFRAETEQLTLLEARAAPLSEAPAAIPSVTELAAEEIGRILPFWADPGERGELGRALEVLAHHPNPGESLRAWVVSEEGRDLASAVAYARGGLAGLHGIGTFAPGRGRGAASAVVRAALRAMSPSPDAPLTTMARGERAAASLERLGFARVAALTEYGLPRDAELHLPAPGPPSPPRWRPPRGLGPG